MSKYNPPYVDDEEKELIESIEKVDTSELKKPSKEEHRATRKAATEYLERRETKMNIRIDPEELQKIKERAQREGLPYQTLVKSVMHKYVTGQLVEKAV